MDLAKLSMDELAGLLENENIWQRRQAQRLISERRDFRLGEGLHAGSRVHKLAESNKDVRFRLAALWSLHAANELEDDFLESLKNDKEPAIRAWVARLTGERGFPFGAAMDRLAALAKDPNATVRLAVAVAARQFVSGSLTVNTPPAIPLREVITGGVLSDLHKSPLEPDDPVLPFIYWMALEPIIAFDAGSVDYYENAKDGDSSQWPMNAYILTRIMRRICDLSEPSIREKQLNTAMRILASIASETNLPNAALDGLIEGFKSKGSPPTISLEPIFAKLTANPAIADKSRHLATLWGESGAIQQTFALVNDAKVGLKERANAIQTLAKLKSPAARDVMLKLIASENPELLVMEALRALSEIGGDTVGEDIIQRWNSFTPGVRQVAGETLTSRSRWAGNLLSAVERKMISASELSATAIRALASFGRAEDEEFRRRFERSIGRVRPTDADKQKIIEAKKRLILEGGDPDLKAGHELAKKTCFVCHKLNGEGADVGPDLTGSGRSTLDALLANVIDPNQIIGKGFENVEVETKDGRSVSGRLVEDTTSHVKLLSSGPKEEVVAKSDIAQTRVSELSVMPEGLEQMPDADFRNMILFILNPPQEEKGR
jgi:putative heme-binding domain-containing protein